MATFILIIMSIYKQCYTAHGVYEDGYTQITHLLSILLAFRLISLIQDKLRSLFQYFSCSVSWSCFFSCAGSVTACALVASFAHSLIPARAHPIDSMNRYAL